MRKQRAQAFAKARSSPPIGDSQQDSTYLTDKHIIKICVHLGVNPPHYHLRV